MLAARRFRVAVSALASLAFLASTVQVVDASYNPQHIVLGRNGQVVDVDPSLYFHDRKMKSAATERAGEEDGLSRAAAGANPRQMDRKPRKQEHDVMRVARVPFHKREDEAAVSQTNVPEKMLLDLQTELRSRDAKENHHDQQQQQSVESNPLDLDHERASVVFADQEMLVRYFFPHCFADCPTNIVEKRMMLLTGVVSIVPRKWMTMSSPRSRRRLASQ